MQNPLVQVICLTYNHANYIRQALDGFISQKTNFNFEVLVGDDCSTDGTRDIVKEYAAKYPSIIQAILREKNIGAMANATDLRNRISAKYIAYCEGDDYWTCPYKLQKQVDILEANPELRGCFHAAKIQKKCDSFWYGESEYNTNEKGEMILPTTKKNFLIKKRYSLNDILGPYIIHTATILYRWNYNIIFPEWLKKQIGGDTTVQILQLGDGEYEFINEIMSVYRVANGVSKFKNRGELIRQTKYKTLLFYKHIKEELPSKYYAKIDRIMRVHFNIWFDYIENNNDLEELKKVITYFPVEFKKTYCERYKENKYYFLYCIPLLKIVYANNKIQTLLFGFIPLYFHRNNIIHKIITSLSLNCMIFNFSHSYFKSHIGLFSNFFIKKYMKKNRK